MVSHEKNSLQTLKFRKQFSSIVANFLGYENSEVPIRVTKFCSEAATINDQSDPGALLMNFANMKGSAAALRNGVVSKPLKARQKVY